MDLTRQVIFIMEVIGTVAFAISGGIVAMEKRMDIFGVLVLGITTATGGGVFRDLVLGITPPTAFVNPLYVEISALTVAAFLIWLRVRRRINHKGYRTYLAMAMHIFDAVGLGAFCVVGVNVAIAHGHSESIYLLIFVGTVTGVGGGVIRDMLAGDMPVIFRKRVYALAAIIGSWAYAVLHGHINESYAMILGALVVVAVRLLAIFLKWNLPVVIDDEGPVD